MKAHYCSDRRHVGDRLVSPLDLYAIRVERRRLSDLSDRKFRQVISPVCRKCADRWFLESDAQLQQELAL
jgi:hypothetical protein